MDEVRLNQKIYNSDFHLHPSYLKSGKKYYESSTGGIVAYEKHLNCHVVAGDPVGQNPTESLAEFFEWSHHKNKAVCGYYFSDLINSSLYWKMHLAGVVRELELQDFVLSGHRSRDIRRALNQGEKSNLRFCQLSERDFSQVKKLEACWMSSRKSMPIKFLLSRLQKKMENSEFWFGVYNQNELEAFVSVLEFSGGQNLYIEQMIQKPGGHKFALDYLLAKLIMLSKQSEYNTLSFGFCAFQKIKPKDLYEWALAINGKFDFIYNSKGLFRYKKKFTEIEKPQFIMFDKDYSSSRQILALLSATYI